MKILGVEFSNTPRNGEGTVEASNERAMTFTRRHLRADSDFRQEIEK
jgi:hypothetical protein